MNIIRKEELVEKFFNAIRYGDMEVLEDFLNKGGDANSYGETGGTLIHAAVFSRRFDMVKLLASNVSDINMREKCGSSPLMFAIRCGDKRIIEYLIFEKRANVNVSDDAGMTPLHLAAFCCFKDVVLWLLKVGADVNTKNKWGDKPVDMVDGKYYDIISLINEYQAPVALDIALEYASKITALSHRVDSVEKIVENTTVTKAEMSELKGRIDEIILMLSNFGLLHKCARLPLSISTPIFTSGFSSLRSSVSGGSPQSPSPTGATSPLLISASEPDLLSFYKKKLCYHNYFLVKNLLINDLFLSFMLSNGVLDDLEWSKLRQSLHVQVTVIADFIEILLRKGPNAYNTFVLYLKEHQPFIATQLEGSSQTPLPCSSS